MSDKARERTHLTPAADKRYLEDMQGRVLMRAQFVGFDEPGGQAMVKARPNAPVQAIDIGAGELTYGQREELSGRLMFQDDLAFEVRPSASGPAGLGIWEMSGDGWAERITAPEPRAEDDHGDGLSHHVDYIPKYERAPGHGQKAEEDQHEESQEHGPSMGM